MPLPVTQSPITGAALPPYYLHADSSHFRDQSGRSVLLRGINLASSAKTPRGQPGAKLDGFWETAESGEMSFVGRVLDLENGVADEHLQRLRGWGFNVLRYIITWEAIEHEGPGKYDQAYVDYTVALLRKCKEHGFLVYIDPHQDLWSRFSGGSGAPYWTLIACGLNPRNFTVTNAACIECEWPSPLAPSPSDYPAMIWATNYSRLACQTLFTLWAAGRDYAPKCILDGVNIQDYLQEHYFAAMSYLGKAIADAGDLMDECVIGWDSLNEPNAGFLGIAHLAEHGKESVLRVGPMPTAFQGLRLGMGEAVEVENWRFGPLGPKRDGSVTIDPKGTRAWLDADAEVNGSPYGWTRGPDWELGTCLWGLHGVWDPETDELLQPDYFDWYRGPDSTENPRKVDYGADYWLAHWRRYAPVIRKFHPEAIHFIQSPVFQIPPKISGPELQGRAVHSTHFYDGLTLVTKHWNWFNADALGILRGKYASVLLGVKVGETAIRKCLREQLGVLRQDTFDSLGQYPTMMGEIGIPFDLDKKKAYTDGDYSNQTRALDASLNACDGVNALNYSIWTYCPDNSHQWGDLWNGEDLSLWSADDAGKMASFRASNSQLDLGGKIPSTRSRADSKASLRPGNIRSSSFYGVSTSSSPNTSVSRLSVLGSELSNKRSVSTNSSPLSASINLPTSPSAPVAPTASFAKLVQPKRDLLPLNDGARALPAFCRPYPVKTVGVPIDINFDVRSSVFTLKVQLDSGSVLDETVATEIFVPLVHYAAYPSSVSKLAHNANHPYLDGGGQLNFADSTLSLPETSLDDPNALALSVKVSAGRWETEGQILRWYYPRPESGSVTLTIEIRRLQGAIASWIHSYGVGSFRSAWIQRGMGAWPARAWGVHPGVKAVVGVGLIWAAAAVLGSR